MTSSPDFTDFINQLVTQFGLTSVEVLDDGILILGLRDGFANLATPESEQTPMDHPTKGLAILCGEDGEGKVVWAGEICYFAKFSAVEVIIKNKRFFVVKRSDVKVMEAVSIEDLQTLVQNTY